ncbi:MAG: haloacid dehalogenase-like hydrolase [Woeseia sp.]
MQLAIFDVDGTLVSGYSTEKRFMAWLLRRGHIGPRQLFAASWFIVRHFPTFGRHVFRKNKAYLSGLSESTIADEAIRFVEALPETAWIQSTVAELRLKKQQSYIVVLLSGSLQPIISALSAHLGTDDAVGTSCHVVNGRYTAAPPEQHPFFEEKATLQQKIIDSYQVANVEVCSYADSRYDIPMLKRVGNPVAVWPDDELDAWAKTNNHRVMNSDKGRGMK